MTLMPACTRNQVGLSENVGVGNIAIGSDPVRYPKILNNNILSTSDAAVAEAAGPDKVTVTVAMTGPGHG
jgi:hypothetical protein